MMIATAIERARVWGSIEVRGNFNFHVGFSISFDIYSIFESPSKVWSIDLGLYIYMCGCLKF